ncbi:uncharacterized protein LOC122643562 [Telopea speciosissima]|uniref:uncharacterized protein LOC122643562 n=1 Tax=Telopea speciosissima TaxID=54955 RepID=UPI001CC82ED0|nr:uncharacterized protein LOC122643562 [Telopea speciosissima]
MEDDDLCPVEVIIKGRNSEVAETRSGKNFKNKNLMVEKYQSNQLSPSVEPENRVLDQLKKAQANISIWGLLMASPTHREAVLKALTKSLFFSEEDLPPGGKNHNRALYITVECNKNQVPQVLINNGSALNVMPLRAARCMGLPLDKLKPSATTIRVYDNSRREVIRILTTTIRVGPGCFAIDFQVIDIQASFNMLLGRPWLHSTGVLASSLHQKLKFIHEQKVITIFGDPEMVHTLANIKVGRSSIPEAREDFPYCGNREPWFDQEKGHLLLGFEILFAEEIDWIAMELNQASKEGIQGDQGIGELFVVAVIIEEEEEGPAPQLLIQPLQGSIANWARMMKIFHIDGSEVIASSSLVLSESVVESVSESPKEVGNDQSVEFVCTLPLIRNEIADSKYDSSSSSSSYSSEDDNILEHHKLLEQLEQRRAQPVREDTNLINLGNDQCPRMIKIGSSLNNDETSQMVSLLKEFEEVFAWSYKDMPGVDPKIVQHRLPTYPDSSPVKQKLRRMRPEWSEKIREEIIKQWNAGFLQVTQYPQWLSNILSVPKKDGKVRMCVDFRDLNKVSPKDDFLLPHIDILVNNTAGHGLLSFMDGFLGYNQISMCLKDRDKTTFTTPWGTFCYKVMPFGLKNAGATYQRAATAILHVMIHKEVEKCVFGARAGKLLGFLVSERGIEVDPDKIKAITEMPPPRIEKEVRGFFGRIQYINRFISRLTTTCEPIFKLLRKKEPKEWNDDCQDAFIQIKEYLLCPPILIPPVLGEPLLLYLSVGEASIGSIMSQINQRDGEEHAISYLSKKLLEYETRYTPVEKTYTSLVWVTRRLRHYMVSHPVKLVSKMDLSKYLFEKPVLTGRMARWLLLLSKFDIIYVNQKLVKGRAISDHLAAFPTKSDLQPIEDSFPDEDLQFVEGSQNEEWQLHFDGAANQKGFKAGILLITPEDSYLSMAFRLEFSCTNNIAEYEACVIGLEMALSVGVKKIKVYGDSSVVIC